MALNFSKEAITIGADKITDKTFTFFKQGFRLNGAIGEPEYRDVTVSGLDVLNLPNAKADGLNYCKLYGKCEQRNLPEGYTEVEYLESTGTQYINTGVVPADKKIQANIKFKYNDLTNNMALIGQRSKSGTTEIYRFATFNNVFRFRINSDYIDTTTADTNIHIIELNGVNGTIYDGTVLSSIQYKTPATGTRQLRLFSINDAEATSPNLNGRVYYCKIFADNVLVRNLIPARRKSDNELGMYDTVAGKFYTNAGIGTFTAGNDVVPTPTRPLNIICNNGVVKVSPNLFDKNNYIKATIDSNGTITQNDDNNLYIMNVSPNNSYIFSYTPITAMSGNCLYGYTKELPTIGGTSTYNIITIGAIRNRVFTVPDGYHYLVIRLNSTTFVPNMRNIQLEQGTTPTTYMPYKQIYTDGTIETVQDSLNNTATAEMLLAVNNYKDVQEVLTGDVTKSVKILVLDGTEAWALYAGTRFYMLIKDMETFEVRKGPLLCSHYYVVSDGRPIGEVPDNSIYTANNPNKIFVQTSAYDNVNDFKAFLASQYNAGTPVIVVYPLATPTTSTVTAQTLTTQEGTNTIEITQASLTDLPIEVNYMAGVSVTVQQIADSNLDNQVTVTIGE